MKRSEINTEIRSAESFFQTHGFYLPSWGHWTPERWKQLPEEEIGGIDELGLGWDLTDFGGGDFDSRGLLLFTLRNGRPEADLRRYAEKVMVVKEDQVTPLHFHWQKTEDIIVRGGGNLVVELFQSDENEEPTNNPVTVMTDGLTRTVTAGEPLVLRPGESITLTPRLYHKFYGQAGSGTVLVGEVSTVNDDAHDNRFYEPVGRFPEIVEDEALHRLLVGDYKAIRRGAP
jgi:hypothetical protein